MGLNEMIAKTKMSVEQYLATRWRPDREYVDGMVIKRGLDEDDAGDLVEGELGTFSHANLQAAVAQWFRNNGKEWNIRAVTEVRMHMTSGHYRIPDVAVFHRDQPIEEYPEQFPPLLVVEVLSPSDTLLDVHIRANEYFLFGVEYVWIISPEKKSWVATPGQLIDGGHRLAIPNTGIYLALSELELD